MEILIDSSDISSIERLCDIYPVDGVTTNPSILVKNGHRPYDVLCDIRSIIGENAQLHIQTISLSASEILDEAHHILDRVSGNTFIKIPAIPEGIKAMRQLSAESIQVTATVIYSPMQAILSAKAGAIYVAPYINRIADLGINSFDSVSAIIDMISKAGLKTKILGASFKNCYQVLSLLCMGAEAVTLSPEIFDKLLTNSSVDNALMDFKSDFERLYGSNANMLTD